MATVMVMCTEVTREGFEGRRVIRRTVDVHVRVRHRLRRARPVWHIDVATILVSG